MFKLRSWLTSTQIQTDNTKRREPMAWKSLLCADFVHRMHSQCATRDDQSVVMFVVESSESRSRSAACDHQSNPVEVAEEKSQLEHFQPRQETSRAIAASGCCGKHNASEQSPTMSDKIPPRSLLAASPWSCLGGVAAPVQPIRIGRFSNALRHRKTPAQLSGKTRVLPEGAG